MSLDETGKPIQDKQTSDRGATITSGGKEKTYTEQEVTKAPSAIETLHKALIVELALSFKGISI
jgi:hypothetical protein